MRFKHHNLDIELDNSWIDEAGMQEFVPTSSAYRVDPQKTRGENVIYVKPSEVEPVKRTSGVEIFNSGDGFTAKERVVSILKGFHSNALIPPIEVISNPHGCQYKYRLADGCHRFYCSMAVGFTDVPAIEGFDISILDV